MRAQVLGEAERPLDLSIKLPLVIVVAAQRGVDLSEGKMRVLEVNFLRAPTMGDGVQGDFANLGVCVIDPGESVGIQPDVRRNCGLHLRRRLRLALIDSNSLPEFQPCRCLSEETPPTVVRGSGGFQPPVGDPAQRARGKRPSIDLPVSPGSQQA